MSTQHPCAGGLLAIWGIATPATQEITGPGAYLFDLVKHFFGLQQHVYDLRTLKNRRLNPYACHDTYMV
jgi:hypothetical protein